jgi:hypothetical protein
MWFKRQKDILINLDHHSTRNQSINSYTQNMIDDSAKTYKLENLTSMLFQLTSTVNVCTGPNAHLVSGHFKPREPLTVIKTKQGLFVTTDIRGKTFQPASPSISLVEQLNLADGNYAQYIEHEAILNNSKALWATHCQQLQQDMQLYKLHDRSYFLNKDINGKEVVFYSDKGTLYQPRCGKESTLQVLDNISNCYEDLPIKLTKYNFTGFLQQDRFIINSSRKRNCSTVDRQYNINSSLIIQQKGMQIILQFVAARSLYEPTPYQLEHEATDFSHHPLLTSNFDPIGVRESKDYVFDNGVCLSLYRRIYRDKIARLKS